MCDSNRHLALFAAALLCGCTALNPPPTIATAGGRDAGRELDRAPDSERIEALTGEIRALSASVSNEEAASCADLSIRYTTLLASTHGLSGSAEFNSLMVNLGVKRRGYCFQLADDLNEELIDQHYRTLCFTRAIAYEDEPFHEHNCVVVTAPGQTFEEGLVLDPWRNPGVLRWARVKLDHYPWVPRTRSLQAAPTTPMPAAAKVRAPPSPAAPSPSTRQAQASRGP